MAPRRSCASGPARFRAQGILDFEAAPARLQVAPAPAEPAATCAHAGAIPGPLTRFRQGEELRLKFANKLAEPTLRFPGLRGERGRGNRRPHSGKAQASRAHRNPLYPSGFRLQSLSARTGSTDASRQGHALFGPITIDELKIPDVELDAAVVLSDWNVDASGRIKDDFADAAIGRGSRRKGGVFFANKATAPLKLKARPGARVRLRLGSAATARLVTVALSGAKIHILAVDGQPSEPFEPLDSQFPVGSGASFELMFDMPRNLAADVRLDLRSDVGAADQPFIAIVSEGEPMDVRAEPPARR
jgi:FtsP/CotA-like multicopper oxidase with cupredoxin domain